MAIQLSDLTNGSTVRASGTQPVWEGTAIFDVLMKAVNENINIQYELTRITGSDYATVYLGAIETCIKEATNLLLQKAIADKEIEVKQAQILNIQEETRLKTAQANAFPLQAAQELALTTEQVLTQKEDTKLKAAQAIAYPLQSEKDLNVKTQQILSMQNDDNIKQSQSTKDLEVKTAQKNKLVDDILTSTKQRESIDKDLEVKDIEIVYKTAQIEAMESDTLIKTAQSTKDLEVKTKEIAVKDQQILTMKSDDSIKSAQSTKDLEVKQANIALTTQQTANLLKDSSLKEANIGLTNKQTENLTKDIAVKEANILLLNRQREGFDDNKYQKLFEAQMNAWALMFSSGLLTDKPTIISNDSASALYNTLKP